MLKFMSYDLIMALSPFMLGPLAFAAYGIGYWRGTQHANEEHGKIRMVCRR